MAGTRWIVVLGTGRPRRTIGPLGILAQVQRRAVQINTESIWLWQVESLVESRSNHPDRRAITGSIMDAGTPKMVQN